MSSDMQVSVKYTTFFEKAIQKQEIVLQLTKTTCDAF